MDVLVSVVGEEISTVMEVPSPGWLRISSMPTRSRIPNSPALSPGPLPSEAVPESNPRP